MATRTNRPGFNWGAFGFSMLQIFLPVALAALEERVTRPTILRVQSQEGLGNFSVSVDPLVSTSSEVPEAKRR